MSEKRIIDIYRRVAIPTIMGALAGAAATGFIESIFKMVKNDYHFPTLPFTAFFYYGLVGLFYGVVLSFFIFIPCCIISARPNRNFLFGIAGAATSIFCLFKYLYVYILRTEVRDLHTVSIAGSIKLSIAIIGIFLVSYLFYRAMIYIVGLITGRVFRILIIVYLAALVITGILFAVYRPGFNYHNKSTAGITNTNTPNIIILLIDALRYDRISPNGYDINTPAMQRLADDGIVYANALAASHWTKPAVASIFTSLLPANHQVFTFGDRLPDGIPLLATELEKSGYHNAAFITNPTITEEFRYYRGFHEYYFLPGTSVLPFIDSGAPTLLQVQWLESNLVKRFRYLKAKRRNYGDARFVTDEILKWLDSNSSARFFIYAHYMDPHQPYHAHPYDGTVLNPLKNAAGEEDIARFSGLYEQEIEFTDQHLLRILDYLKRNNLYDSTMIILTADHGEEFFDHYAWDHVNSLYDELLHIPLIIKLPHSERAGQANSAYISQIDFAPSILQYIDAAPPGSWMGRNFFDPGYFRDVIIAQSAGSYCIRTAEYKWIQTTPGYAENRLSQPRLSRIEHLDPRALFPEESLFDLIHDPGEKNNLFGSTDAHPIIKNLLKPYDVEQLMPSGRGSGDLRDLQETTIERLRALGYLE